MVVVHSHGVMGFGFVGASVASIEALISAAREVAGVELGPNKFAGRPPVPGVAEMSVPAADAPAIVRALKAAGVEVAYAPGTEPIAFRPVAVRRAVEAEPVTDAAGLLDELLRPFSKPEPVN